MKHCLTISLLVFSANALYGQPQNNRHFIHHDPVFKYAQHIVTSKTANKVAKTTATKQRVVAQSGYDIWGGIPTLDDSLWFKYTGANGSVFDYNELTYEPYFSPDARENMFAYGDILIKADTVQREVGTTLTPYEMITNRFNSAGMLNDYSQYFHLNPNQSERSLVNYDASGKPTIVWLFTWNPLPIKWDTSGKIAFAYNSVNQLESDTSYEYNSGVFLLRSTSSYVYDWGGFLINKMIRQDLGWGLTDFERYTFGYYPNHSIKEMVVESNNGSALRPHFKYEIAHDPANLFITQETVLRHDSQNDLWEPFSRTTRGANLQGLPDTSRFYNWFGNDWYLYEKAITTFNAENNPEQVVYYRPGVTGLEYKYQHKFYYETYNILGVDERSERGNIVQVYPNPAADFINIQIADQNSRIENIRLVNSTGQIVGQKHIGKIPGTEQLSLSGLASGLYYLVVTGSDGAVIHKQPVLKQ